MADAYDLMAVQQCLSADGWAPVRILSSDGENHYTVLVNPWGDPDENICQCEGYQFRGYCRHQRIASKELCGWTEVINGDLDISENQTDKQKLNKICPRCNGRTMWTMEVVNVGTDT